ncbi:hypothetical protein TWF506_004584 [Arthrobotrys conoides]|uniref:Uncharacterized protein n=1 Tax=Arthrobotrys conoides TaxID=74498 RepID=A0AAN8N2D0_9PEZI
MSRDLFGEFGDFQSGGGGGGGSTTSNNTFATSTYPPSNSQPTSNSNFDDLLGLFNSSPQPQVNNNYNNYNNNNNNNNFKQPFQSTTSETTISGQLFTNDHTTTLFTSSPHQNPLYETDLDDDFGDFAVEPLPSTNPTFGPLSNNSPPLKPSQPIPTILHPSSSQKEGEDVNDDDDDDFGTFISTPRIPTPPPTFSLSSTITNSNHLHPSHPPPPLHTLLPTLTTHLLSPLPFLTRLKPLSYPAKQRLLTSPKVKKFFIAIIMISHVVGRLIASKKIRGRRSYKGRSGIEGNKRNEGLKDEREVVECVREYNEIVGSLRAVVRGMGVVVVELSGDMGISTSSSTTNNSKKGKKGNVNNGEFCWLCGLSPIDKVLKLKEDETIESGKDIDGGEKWIRLIGLDWLITDKSTKFLFIRTIVLHQHPNRNDTLPFDFNN